MTYKEKLKKWNDTDKYREELDFLYKLISPKYGDVILDFGCGIMTAINNFNARGEAFFYGYDVEEYGEQEDYHLYDKEINRKYDCIYYMHSFAHIKAPKFMLEKLRDSLTEDGRIVVLTPNLDWLDYGYNNDPTVIRHYTIDILSKIFTDAGYKIKQTGQFGEPKDKVNERIFLIANKL